MAIDSVAILRSWGSRLEQALGIPICPDDSGAMVLKTKQGQALGITPVPGHGVLVFTGILGIADASVRVDTLLALLALNMAPSCSGMGCVGLAPDTREIALRLSWVPAPENWTEQAFAATLTAFVEHIDALATAIVSGDIEQILTATTSIDVSPASPDTGPIALV